MNIMSQSEVVLIAKNILDYKTEIPYLNKLKDCIENTLHNLEIDRLCSEESCNQDINKLNLLVDTFNTKSKLNLDERIKVI